MVLFPAGHNTVCGFCFSLCRTLEVRYQNTPRFKRCQTSSSIHQKQLHTNAPKHTQEVILAYLVP